MIPVVVWGAGGRMGKRLIKLVLQASDLKLMGAVEAEGHPGIFQDAGQYPRLAGSRRHTGHVLRTRCSGISGNRAGFFTVRRPDRSRRMGAEIRMGAGVGHDRTE